MATMRPHHHPTTTPSSPWRWAWLGAAAGLLLATLAWAPARWLAAAVAQATQHQVQLRQARGTVWEGDAVLALTPGHASDEVRSLPSRLHWQWGLTWPGLTLRLSSECCTPQPMQWRLTPQNGGLALTLIDQTSTWPLSLLAGLGAPWNTLQTEGRLQWQSAGLRLGWTAGRWRWHGQAQLLVQDLASRLSTARPMGSYRITLQGTDTGTATPELALVTLNGPLRLNGQGQWVGHRLRFTGEASADEGSEAALSNLLNIIGRREGPRSRLSLG
jgi:general secretion pathway protein N